MTTFSKILVAVVAAATLGVIVNSAFAHGGHGGAMAIGLPTAPIINPTAPISHTTTAISLRLLPTITMLMTTPATTATLGWDHHGGYGRFSGGHDRRR